MKEAYVYRTISTIIAGVVLALFYFFLQGNEEEIQDRIVVEYRKFEMPRLMIAHPLIMILDELDLDEKEIYDIYYKKYGYYDSFTLVEYKIINNTEKNLENIDVFFNEFVIAMVSDAAGSRKIEANHRNAQISILPNSTAIINLILKFEGYILDERFLIGGNSIEIIEIEPSLPSTSALPAFLEKNPYLNFMLSLVGVVVLALLMIMFITSMFIRNRPDILAKTEDVGNVARSLALLNWMKEEEEDRYDKVVKRAEKLYQHWRAKR